MSAIVRGFDPDIIVNPETGKLDLTYRPYMLIKLGFQDQWSKNYIRALLDSRSDFNFFPPAFAAEIGVDFTKGKVYTKIGSDRHADIFYLHYISLQIENLKIETIICFGESVKTPTLGRIGFFNFFERITFRTNDKITELKY